MQTTDCLGLPYPECDPPLTKDASDIEQFRDLAEATDAAVQAFADSVSDRLLNPDAVNMFGGSNAAGQDIVHFTSGVNFDNAGMSDTVADVIRVVEDGWYIVGGWVAASSPTHPTPTNIRIEPLVNGDVVSARQGPGAPAIGSEYVAWVDVLQLRAGDVLQTMTHHTDAAATVFTYATVLWAQQILINV